MQKRSLNAKRISSGIYTGTESKTFLTEFAEEIPGFEMQNREGVAIRNEGDSLRLVYDGLLAKSGASHVYAAVSVGDNSNWHDVRYYKMDKRGQDTFEAVIPKSESTNVNIAFKDCANNWDNNSGMNYSFNVH